MYLPGYLAPAVTATATEKCEQDKCCGSVGGYYIISNYNDITCKIYNLHSKPHIPVFFANISQISWRL